MIIYINKKAYETPQATAACALYTLAGIDPTKYDLWLENLEGGDDYYVPPQGEVIIGNTGSMRFYSTNKQIL